MYVNTDASVETRFRIDKINPADLDGRVVILHNSTDNFGNIPFGTGPTQYAANSPDAIAARAKPATPPIESRAASSHPVKHHKPWLSAQPAAVETDLIRILSGPWEKEPWE